MSYAEMAWRGAETECNRLRADNDRLRDENKAARSLLQDATLHLNATRFNEGLRARIESFLAGR